VHIQHRPVLAHRHLHTREQVCIACRGDLLIFVENSRISSQGFPEWSDVLSWCPRSITKYCYGNPNRGFHSWRGYRHHHLRHWLCDVLPTSPNHLCHGFHMKGVCYISHYGCGFFWYIRIFHQIVSMRHRLLIEEKP